LKVENNNKYDPWVASISVIVHGIKTVIENFECTSIFLNGIGRVLLFIFWLPIRCTGR